MWHWIFWKECENSVFLDNNKNIKKILVPLIRYVFGRLELHSLFVKRRQKFENKSNSFKNYKLLPYPTSVNCKISDARNVDRSQHQNEKRNSKNNCKTGEHRHFWDFQQKSKAAHDPTNCATCNKFKPFGTDLEIKGKCDGRSSDIPLLNFPGTEGKAKKNLRLVKPCM